MRRSLVIMAITIPRALFYQPWAPAARAPRTDDPSPSPQGDLPACDVAKAVRGMTIRRPMRTAAPRKPYAVEPEDVLDWREPGVATFGPQLRTTRAGLRQAD